MALTPTQLRADLYRLLDQVIETRQPLLIHRGSATIRISLVESAAEAEDPLNVVPLCSDLIVGDPAELVSLDWLPFWTAGKDL